MQKVNALNIILFEININQKLDEFSSTYFILFTGISSNLKWHSKQKKS